MSKKTNCQLITQDDVVLINLLEFYKKNNNLEKILPIINGESKVSLRIIDWFTTNYSKEHYTIIYLKNDKRIKVYEEYKDMLSSFSKKKFDPFCRGPRIFVPYKNNKSIQTTIGQLKFFKWVLENNIIEYILKNYEHIEKDMNSRNSTSKKKKDKTKDSENKTRKHREELSFYASKCIKKEYVNITIKFD